MYDVLVACSYFFVHSDSMSVFFLEMIGTRTSRAPIFSLFILPFYYPRLVSLWSGWRQYEQYRGLSGTAHKR